MTIILDTIFKMVVALVESHSEESKKKMSDARKGKPLSEEWKKKLSESRRGKKRSPHSQDTKEKLKERAKELRGKKVICDNRVFDSISDCAEYYDIKADTMRKWFTKNRMPKNFINLGLAYYI